jgi:alanine dehydrogenase
MTLLLSNEEIDSVLTMDMALEAVEQSQLAVDAQRAINSPRVDTLSPATREGVDGVYGLKSMSGLLPEAGVAALRINSDVLVWPTVAGNLRRDRLPNEAGRWNGLLILFSTATGEPLLICPDGYISRFRVGAANGLAARHMARADARVMALLGSGWQAGGQLLAHCAVRPLEEIRVFSPTAGNPARFCREMQPRVRARLRPVDSAEEAVRGADIVAAGTNAMSPVLRREWLSPGVHFGAVKVQEVDAAFIQAVDRACLFSRGEATSRPVLLTLPSVHTPEGEPGWWSERDRAPWSAMVTLADLLTGRVPGRLDAGETTLFVNNVGQGIQFAALGRRVYDAALAAGVGRPMPTEWFTQLVHP